MTGNTYTRSWFEHGPVVAADPAANLAFVILAGVPDLERLTIVGDGSLMTVVTPGYVVPEGMRRLGDPAWTVEFSARIG